MTTTTHGTIRTARLLALMKKGDDAFNARDFAGPPPSGATHGTASFTRC